MSNTNNSCNVYTSCRTYINNIDISSQINYAKNDTKLYAILDILNIKS